jgi:hypothetical protein
MVDRECTGTIPKLALAAALVFVLAGCGGGATKPCDNSDPVGPCATSHGQTHGG